MELKLATTKDIPNQTVTSEEAMGLYEKMVGVRDSQTGTGLLMCFVIFIQQSHL
jgi:hypothetical protein